MCLQSICSFRGTPRPQDHFAFCRSRWSCNWLWFHWQNWYIAPWPIFCIGSQLGEAVNCVWVSVKIWVTSVCVSMTAQNWMAIFNCGENHWSMIMLDTFRSEECIANMFRYNWKCEEYRNLHEKGFTFHNLLCFCEVVKVNRKTLDLIFTASFTITCALTILTTTRHFYNKSSFEKPRF